jgi:hypothetical protein
LSKARYRKVTTAITTVLALGSAYAAGGPAIGVLATVAAPLFSLGDLKTPCWKDLQEKQCFPAGVVYEATQLSAPSR